MNSPRHSIYSKIFRVFFAVGGTFVILILAWRYLSIEVLLDSFQDFHFVPLLVAFLMYFVVAAVRASRFVLVDANIFFSDAFCMAAVHNALLRVMPFRSGELAYGIMLKRMGKGEFGQGVATVLMLRLLDFTVIMAMAASSVSSYFSSSNDNWFALIIVLSFFAMGTFFFASTPLARVVNRHVSAHVSKGNTSFWIKTLQAIESVLELSLRQRIFLIASTAILWFSVLMWFYFLMIGIGMSIDYQSALSSGMLGIVGSILPLSIIGSFGPMEGGFAVGFCAIGYDPYFATTQSVIISTFTFIHNWALAIPGWFWVLAHSIKKK
ncbi:MAG: flippase-like domain-containing protein [Proteobacteria bacterium]|nr:flippase-like domain-containing protein [Pseudomonadota bacterium]